MGETPEQTLIRELNEEVGIQVTDYQLFDSNSIVIDWNYKGQLEKIHHVGIFYKVSDYKNELLENINIDKQNDDSSGAKYYKINYLRKSELSAIAILEMEKLGYKLED